MEDMLKDVVNNALEVLPKLKSAIDGDGITKISDNLLEYLTQDCKNLKQRLYAKDMFFINREKKTICLKTRSGRVQLVKCHEDDVFDEKIGIALAVERMGFKVTKRIHGEKNRSIQIYRFLKTKLNIKDYSDFVLAKFWKIEPSNVNDKIKELKGNGEIKYVGKEGKENE